MPEALHIALFIRDAIGLSTTEDGAPPRLLSEVPDRSSLVDSRSHEHVASLWRSWSYELTANGQSAAELSAPDGGDLGRAARELEAEAFAWLGEHKKPQVPPLRDPLRDWEITRDAAEAATMELGVEPGEVHADTWLLLVEGAWCQHPAPGQLFYSPAVRDDKTLFFEVLRSTFLSSV